MSTEAFAVLARLGGAPLVGRDAELRFLLARVETAASQPGAVMIVSGEPGSGKTRLVTEVARAASAKGACIIFCRCYDQTQVLPYAPFLDSTLKLPELATLLHSSLEEVVGARNEEGAKLGLFEKIDHFLLDLAGPTPLALVVDDLQWADAASLDLLRHLARRGRRGGRVILATVRNPERAVTSLVSTFLADVTREGLLVEIALPPLGQRECSALLADLMGVLDHPLADAIYARTGGLPFFVEELVRLLVSAGFAILKDEIWQLAGIRDLAHLPVPPSVSATILQRLRRLPAETRGKLSAAAALGVNVPAVLLAHVLDCAEASLLEDLTPALSTHLLRATYTADAEYPTTYTFAHVLYRDVLYAELPPDERRSLHHRIVRALVSGPASARTMALLAFHAERARDWQQTFDASLVAGDAAMRALAPHEALTHFQRARNLAASSHVPVSQAEQFALDRRILRALLGRGRIAEAAKEAQAVVERAWRLEERTEEAWALAQLGLAAIFTHQLDLAFEALERARRLAGALGDDALLATALSHLTVLYDKRGLLDEAAACIEQALPLAEQVGNRAVVLQGFTYLGYMANWRGEFVAATSRLREACSLAREALDLHSLASAQFALALALAGRGAYEAALDELHQLEDFSAVTGEPYYAVRVPNTIGWIYRELAFIERALEWDERAVAEASGGDWPGLFEARANSLLNLAFDLILLGRLEEAELRIAQAAEAAAHDEFMRWRNLNRLALCQGELALAQGKGELALAAAEDALAQAERTHSGKYLFLGQDLAGRALSLLQRDQEAVRYLEQAIAKAASLCYRAGHWRSLVNLGAVLTRLGEAGRSSECCAQARALVDALATSLQNPELRAAFLEAPPVAALTAKQEAAPDGRRALQTRSSLPVGLSQREVEVLRLLAQGLTNREIAASLVVSERTINSHLVHIFNKVGVTSRAAATAFAVRHGLVD